MFIELQGLIKNTEQQLKSKTTAAVVLPPSPSGLKSALSVFKASREYYHHDVIVLSGLSFDASIPSLTVKGDHQDYVIPHRCQPNAVVSEGSLIAYAATRHEEGNQVLAIPKGSDIVVNYNLLCYDFHDGQGNAQPRVCHCADSQDSSSSACGGVLSGFKYLPLPQQQELLLLCEAKTRQDASHKGGIQIPITSNPQLMGVVDKPSHGGVVTIAKQPIPADTLILPRCDGLMVPRPTMFTLSLSETKHLLFQPDAMCLGHSCTPNGRIELLKGKDGEFDGFQLWSIRDIACNEIISFNYLTTEWSMDVAFECHCREEEEENEEEKKGCVEMTCYRSIRGFYHLTREQQEALLPRAMPWIQKKIQCLWAMEEGEIPAAKRMRLEGEGEENIHAVNGNGYINNKENEVERKEDRSARKQYENLLTRLRWTKGEEGDGEEDNDERILSWTNVALSTNQVPPRMSVFTRIAEYDPIPPEAQPEEKKKVETAEGGNNDKSHNGSGEEKRNLSMEEYITLWIQKLSLEWKKQLVAEVGRQFTSVSNDVEENTVQAVTLRKKVSEYINYMKALHPLRQGLLEMSLHPTKTIAAMTKNKSTSKNSKNKKNDGMEKEEDDDEDRLNENVLLGLYHVFRHVEVKKYLKAEEAYFDITIGSEVWHMGLYSAGSVHMRRALEKVQKSNIKHIMNNPIARQYLYAIKMLINVAMKMDLGGSENEK